MHFKIHDTAVPSRARLRMLLIGAACLVLISSEMRAGDATPDMLLSPVVSGQVGEPVALKVLLKNLREFPVGGISTWFRIGNAVTKQIVFISQHVGSSVAAYGMTIVTAPDQWTCLEAGDYEIEVRIASGNDVNPANDMKIFTVRMHHMAMQPGSNFPGSGFGGDPVNLFTGEYLQQEKPDLALNGPMPLSFARSYSSHYRSMNVWMSPLGTNWAHSFCYSLKKYPATLHVVTPAGLDIRFTPSGGDWILENRWGVPYQLAAVNNEFRLADPLGQQLIVFDTAGVLLRIEDRNGNVHSCSYANGRLSAVADGLGRQLSFTYDTQGRMTQVSDGSRSVAFGYSGGTLTSVTDARGATTTYEYAPPPLPGALLVRTVAPEGNAHYSQQYDSTGRVLRQRDAFNNEAVFTYTDSPATRTDVTEALGGAYAQIHDANGRMTALIDKGGSRIELGYDAAGRRSSVTNRSGNQATFQYDTVSGKLSRRTNVQGNTTAYEYTPRSVGPFTFHDLTKITEADLSSTTLSYDANGNLRTRTERGGGVWSYTYNTRGLPLTMTNPAGGATTFTYDASGMPATMTDPTGKTTTYSYDAQSRLVGIGYADGSTKTITRDAHDNITAVKNETGAQTTFQYDKNDRLTSASNGLGNTVQYAYDAMDRIVSITDAEGASETWTWDELGRRKTRTNRGGETHTYGYDVRDHVISIRDHAGSQWKSLSNEEGILLSLTDPDNRTWNYESNKLGKTLATESPLGRRVSVVRDALGRILRWESPSGSRTSYTYDAADNLAAIALPGDSIRVQFTHNALGQVVDATDPMAGHWTAQYDAQGRLISRADPLGKSTTVTYDNRNRIARLSTPEEEVNLSYDGAGRLTQRSASDGTTLSFTYDAAGRLTAANGLALAYDRNSRVVGSNGIAIARDAGSRIAAITFASGKTVQYTYAANGLVSRISDWLGGETVFTYDASRRLTGLTRPNGSGTSFTYNEDGQLTAIRHGSLAQIILTRDQDGRVVQADRQVPLASAPAPDVRGKQYDAASQVASFTYDKLGRLRDDGDRSYSWDGASRLKTYTAGGASVSFSYDATGRMLSRTQGGTTQQFVRNYAFDVEAVSVERRDGTDRYYYVHTPAGRLLYRVDAASGERTFYHYDELGSTILLTDESGNDAGRYAYSPYGQVLADTGPADNPFTWLGAQGVMREAGTDLYAMRLRFYSSRDSRFISRDPIELTGPKDINPYQYALADPMRYVDPSGAESYEESEAGIPAWYDDLLQWLAENKRSGGLDWYTGADDENEASAKAPGVPSCCPHGHRHVVVTYPFPAGRGRTGMDWDGDTIPPLPPFRSWMWMFDYPSPDDPPPSRFDILLLDPPRPEFYGYDYAGLTLFPWRTPSTSAAMEYVRDPFGNGYILLSDYNVWRAYNDFQNFFGERNPGSFRWNIRR